MSMNAQAPSILFVDDEPMLLEGVRRSWRVECSSDPEGAIERMGSESFDCVVSDMRMPAMDGASLLGRVVAAQPGTILAGKKRSPS